LVNVWRFSVDPSNENFNRLIMLLLFIFLSVIFLLAALFYRTVYRMRGSVLKVMAEENAYLKKELTIQETKANLFQQKFNELNRKRLIKNGVN
jgi:hypothetical protein